VIFQAIDKLETTTKQLFNLLPKNIRNINKNVDKFLLSIDKN